MSTTELGWLCVGFAGQAVFTGRFVVQWIASERRGESFVPLSFWYLSLLGGGMLLAYAMYKADPVFITGQLFGVTVYSRNLTLIRRKRQRQAQDDELDSSVVHLARPTAKLGAHGRVA